MLKPVSARCERLLGPEDRLTLSARAALARAYGTAHRRRKAVALFRQVADGYERTLGPGHPLTRQYRDWLDQLSRRRG